MNEKSIKKFINKGECRNIEFKEAVNEVPINLYETVCSFLNRSGGIIILGVNNKGKIVGVNELNADSMINSIVTTSNNRDKLNPPFILFPSKIKLKEGLIIYIQVPESSQVHKCDNIIFDRSDDGDFRITDQQLLTALYNRKSTHDRLQVTTNLIDAYDLLMGFIAKHLPDKFFMEDDKRVSLREKIFREVIANMIIHREYTNAHPASLTIYIDRVELLNANKPHHHGKINPINFSPYPKNPLISKFFLQLGRAEEIGSGILNVNKYLLSYSPNKVAEFIDDDIFKTIIPVVVKEKVEVFTAAFKTIADVIALTSMTGPLDDIVNATVSGIVTEAVSDAVNGGVNGGVSGGVSGGVNDVVKERLKEELGLIIFNRGITLVEIIKKFRLAKRTAERDIKLLRDLGFVTFEGAPRTGRYIVTEKTKQIRIKGL